MEVILKEDVVGLGYKDDVVTVKNGYGRNFLIPTGKAIIATEAARKIRRACPEVPGRTPLYHGSHQRRYG